MLQCINSNTGNHLQKQETTTLNNAAHNETKSICITLDTTKALFACYTL